MSLVSSGQAAVTIVRQPRLAERVLFVGGLPGCGKTMMSPIVGSLARVELQKFNYPLEHVCGMRLLGSIAEDVATAMIRLLTDLDLYNLAMSREVNLRCTDLSSVFRNPGTWRYLWRLIRPGDAQAADRIRRERPILHITMHNALAISPPLFAALGEAARILEVVRHPLYMIKQWRLFIDRYGTDARNFSLWFEYDGRALPFFAQGWEERYLRSNAMDRSIYAIERLLQLGQEAFRALEAHQQLQVLVVPFEPFVLDPWPYLSQVEVLLETQLTALTRRELRRQRVPRRRIADGITRQIYAQYGWEPAAKGQSERAELERRRRYAAAEATAQALDVLDRLSAEYEAAHLHGMTGW